VAVAPAAVVAIVVAIVVDNSIRWVYDMISISPSPSHSPSPSPTSA
jgi:hypothetical protein